MSNGSEVLIYLSFLLKEAVIYLVAAAAPNKHMVAMYQKLSFSDFILFHNSKNRHLEFLNLSPQGLISSVINDITAALFWCFLQLVAERKTLKTLQL